MLLRRYHDAKPTAESDTASDSKKDAPQAKKPAGRTRSRKG